MLAWLTKLLENTNKPIGTVVHIGAGVGTELPVYQDLHCERVLAIEADDTLFKKLRTKAKRYPNVSVHQAWIADKESEQMATAFANPRFNSLLPASKLLMEHFPNVKATKSLNVITQAFDTFVKENTKITVDKADVLVLEVQGYEASLLKSCPASTLHFFDWIVVRTSQAVLFEGGANATAVNKYLAEQGFELRLSEASQQPFVEQYYQFNSSKVTLEMLEFELAKRNEESALQHEKLIKC